MRIGIFTLPMHGNYGGILQAYALQTVLQRMGYEVSLLKHSPNLYRRLSLSIRYLIYLKRFILRYFFHQNLIVCEDKQNIKMYRGNMREIEAFISSYIKSVDYNIEKSKLPHFDVIVVGSDQVWRPIYALPIEKYFLNFLESNSSVKKIAYAASFGTNEWEFTPEQTIRCALLAQKFDLITVREDSAVKLCKEYFDVDAIQVLDPTMLLDKEDYIQIVQNEKTPQSTGNLFSYMLDDNAQKQNVVYRVVQEKGLTSFSIMLTEEQIKAGTAYPCVSVWLRAFMDAKYVVTDSFHGCVFSIIFNKPFIAIVNKRRGHARFKSLLNLFGLQDRLVDLDESSWAMDVIDSSINWNKVNLIRERMKLFSMNCLLGAIKA